MLMPAVTCGQCPLLWSELSIPFGSLIVSAIKLNHFPTRLIGAGWLSPELYLRRPPAKNEQYRIDRMLQQAAERGVKVNIIVYKEVGTTSVEFKIGRLIVYRLPKL
jgi:hypothetical protein